MGCDRGISLPEDLIQYLQMKGNVTLSSMEDLAGNTIWILEIGMVECGGVGISWGLGNSLE